MHNEKIIFLFLLWECLINIRVDPTKWHITTNANVTINGKMADHVIFDNHGKKVNWCKFGKGKT
jgi:hypothetical protein